MTVRQWDSKTKGQLDSMTVGQHYFKTMGQLDKKAVRQMKLRQASKAMGQYGQLVGEQHCGTARQ